MDRRPIKPDHFLAALDWLITVAHGDTGQAGRVRRFLLGLYNGREWPFDLTDLRALDTDLQQACLDVLAVDVLAVREIHTWFDHRRAELDRTFGEWWQLERPGRDRGMRDRLRAARSTA